MHGYVAQIAEHLMELQSYHSQFTSCEVCRRIWMVLSVISYFIKNLMSQQCCSYIRLVACETSQYEVVAFETRWHKYLYLGYARHCMVVVSMWNTFAGTEI